MAEGEEVEGEAVEGEAEECEKAEGEMFALQDLGFFYGDGAEFLL